MRLSFNLERKDIFAKIVMKMDLYVSRKMVTKFEQSSQNGNVFDVFLNANVLNRRQVKKLKDYQKGYEVLPNMRPMRVIQLIRQDIGYEASIKNRAEKFGYRYDHLTEILNTVERFAILLGIMI